MKTEQVEILALWADDEETDVAAAGENVKLKVRGVEEDDVRPGFVLCDGGSDSAPPCTVGRVFDARLMLLECKSIICAGYGAVMHLHCLAEEVTLQSLLWKLDKRTGEKTDRSPRYLKSGDMAIARFEVSGGVVCIETFKDFPQMGRFNLRDEGKTVAIGKVLKVHPE